MRNLTMLTDLYQMTMMNGYIQAGIPDRIAVFDLFYRKNPGNAAFAVAAGLEQVIDYIENLHFDAEDIAYLRSLNLFDEKFFDYLKDFRFTGEIYAMPEGTVVFPYEPLLRVKAPIFEAQLIETAMLNIVNHQTLIASKAARVCQAAQGDLVMEFGLRRAQGPDAGLYGARAALIAGCGSTSNVLAGKMFDVPVAGTHAHSWVMSFPDELTAFRAYADAYPDACLLLVDTYDTLGSGMPNAIRVFRELREKGHEPLGVRLDSGDLSYLCAPGAPDAGRGRLPQREDLRLRRPGRGRHLGPQAAGRLHRHLGRGHAHDHLRRLRSPGRRLQDERRDRGRQGRAQDQDLRKPQQGHQPRHQEGAAHLQPRGHGHGRPHPAGERADRPRKAPDHLPPRGHLEAPDLHGLHAAGPACAGVCGRQVRLRAPDAQADPGLLPKEISTLWEQYRRRLNPHVYKVDLSYELYALRHKLLNQARTEMDDLPPLQ